MSRARSVLLRLLRHCSATTAVEYALIAFLVSLVGFVLYGNIGGSITGFFQNVADSF